MHAVGHPKLVVCDGRKEGGVGEREAGEGFRRESIHICLWLILIDE